MQILKAKFNFFLKMKFFQFNCYKIQGQKKKREVVQWLGHLAQMVGGSPGFWR